jgi:hypothetical protein
MVPCYDDTRQLGPIEGQERLAKLCYRNSAGRRPPGREVSLDLLADLAVGGCQPGSADATTGFPATRPACVSQQPAPPRDERRRHCRFNALRLFAWPRHDQQHVDVLVHDEIETFSSGGVGLFSGKLRDLCDLVLIENVKFPVSLVHLTLSSYKIVKQGQNGQIRELWNRCGAADPRARGALVQDPHASAGTSSRRAGA